MDLQLRGQYPRLGVCAQRLSFAPVSGAKSHNRHTIRATKELPVQSFLLCKCFSCCVRYLSSTSSPPFCFLAIHHYERNGRLATLLKCLVLAVGGVAILNKLQPLLGLNWF